MRDPRLKQFKCAQRHRIVFFSFINSCFYNRIIYTKFLNFFDVICDSTKSFLTFWQSQYQFLIKRFLIKKGVYGLTVDDRGCRDRFNNILEKFNEKNKEEFRASGIQSAIYFCCNYTFSFLVKRMAIYKKMLYKKLGLQKAKF